jgi:signal peptidase I
MHDVFTDPVIGDNVLTEYLKLFIEILVFIFFVMTFLVQSFVIPSGSMEKNLLIGDHLMVDKVAFSQSLFYLEKIILPKQPIQRSMIITFKYPLEPQKEYVKRVIGLPGDRIKITDKKVYVNGKLLAEPYIQHIDREIIKERDCFSEFSVPQNHFFCLGDNRDNSSDSRFWGCVPESYVIGKPWRLLWSIQAEASDYADANLLKKLTAIIDIPFNILFRSRWLRTAKKIY